MPAAFQKPQKAPRSFFLVSFNLVLGSIIVHVERMQSLEARGRDGSLLSRSQARRAKKAKTKKTKGPHILRLTKFSHSAPFIICHNFVIGLWHGLGRSPNPRFFSRFETRRDAFGDNRVRVLKRATATPCAQPFFVRAPTRPACMREPGSLLAWGGKGKRNSREICKLPYKLIRRARVFELYKYDLSLFFLFRSSLFPCASLCGPLTVRGRTNCVQLDPTHGFGRVKGDSERYGLRTLHRGRRKGLSCPGASFLSLVYAKERQTRNTYAECRMQMQMQAHRAPVTWKRVTEMTKRNNMDAISPSGRQKKFAEQLQSLLPCVTYRTAGSPEIVDAIALPISRQFRKRQ
ncbi:uncharacterized protein F4807DRAFT_394770 [Annulohypoxylon truncatum]|uniref:uncharacterized protein n=1 Tax=Annulohypoxylon truncatum TaxID=327061 RepID=UPI002007CF43|nr:uncharacterized protein F4807DRAFT_394770 [Annulohypoxylon truncatum]KAI1211581.1 hypothetical protein F4807DRAFT_394770 [Annulohypoxylon truncatum]